MKLCGFYKKSLTNYEDDQIVIPIAEAKCLNIAQLIEYATIHPLYSLDEYANLYKTLGHEFGIEHLNSNETILILNFFDINLNEQLQALCKPDDSPETRKVLHDKWYEIRHEYVKAELEARLIITSRRFVPILPCIQIKRFEYPQAFSTKSIF